MSDVVIRVENLAKMYRIGGKQEGYDTLRDALVRGAYVRYDLPVGHVLKE